MYEAALYHVLGNAGAGMASLRGLEQQYERRGGLAVLRSDLSQVRSAFLRERCGLAHHEVLSLQGRARATADEEDETLSDDGIFEQFDNYEVDHTDAPGWQDIDHDDDRLA